MVLVQDLLHPDPLTERSRHKLKRLVQAPNTFFIDVKCPGCRNINTIFSHAQTVITCDDCSSVVATPSGGKCHLTEGASFRRK
ncbi:40S ribosomal protein S27-B [Spathaspora passalidarum NRRL Y-27907]|uniref:40S ribosomal protein S27 n=1 Tax=Spathaspora passalidarum (strain NRRL Y-27907 / 11-Y1) TaxID=619300 RepID=G3AGL4_SPAPN|nr:40S ribosomal protein S27-B [Spathaspora passalidarum NRRL Y-27907]EGW35353.1 40S ribosomal protein S27-B [Spathaspora passalidarum NRRL Y-27907]